MMVRFLDDTGIQPVHRGREAGGGWRQGKRAAAHHHTLTREDEEADHRNP